MKKRYYILARIIGFLLVALCTAVFLIQVPSVQTQLTKAAVSMLSEKLDAEVSIGKVQIVPGSGLHITDLAVIDRKPYTEDRYGKGYEPSDSFFVASSIKARITLSGLLKGMPLRFSSVQVDGGQMCLVAEPDAEPYLNNLQRIFGIPAPTVPPPPGTEDVFLIKNVQINNFRFRLKNFTEIPQVSHPGGYGFNWQDLEVFTNVTARNLHFNNGIMSGGCERCEIWTRDGYRIHSVTGDVAVGRGKTLIKNLNIVDDWSDLKLDYFTMTYSNGLVFQQFTDSVSLAGKFVPGTLSFQTLKNIVGIMPDNTVLLDIEQGEVRGPVNKLNINGLVFQEKASGIKGRIDRASLNGVTDIENFRFSADIPYIRINSQSVPGFVSRFTGKGGIKLPEGLDTDIDLSIKGAGLLNDFNADVKLQTGIGKAYTNAKILHLTNPRRDIEISGALSTEGVSPGGILKIDELGGIDLGTRFYAILGEDSRIELDSLKIDRVAFMGYDYHGISGGGTIDKDDLKFNLLCKEDNLDFSINAISKGEGYDLDATISNANLRALGLEEKIGFSAVRGILAADIDALDKDRRKGMINLADLHFEKGGSAFTDIDTLNVDVDQDSIGLALKLSSKLVSGDFYGKSVDDFTIKADIHDRERILNFFVPGLYVADNSSFSAQRTPGDKIELKLESPLIGYNKNYIKELNIDLNYNDGNADFFIESPEIGLGSTILDKTTIRLVGDYITSEKDVTMHTQPDVSFISISDQRWNISNSTIYVGEDGLKLENFSLNGDNEERIFANGGFSKNNADTLLVILENLDFSLLDDVTASKYNIEGKVNGIANIESPSVNGLKLDAAITMDKLTMRGKPTGDFGLAASVDGTRILAGLNNTSSDGQVLLNALADIDTGTGKLDADAQFNGLRLESVQPILDNIFSETGGLLKGKLKASGTLDSLHVNSDELELDDALLRVKATNVPYCLNGILKISETGISLEKIRVNDDEDGSGFLSGKLSFNKFENPELDAELTLDKLKLLGKPNNGSDFYGTAYGDGDILVSGPLNALNIDVNISTAKNGSIHVPVGSALAAESKVLSFVQKQLYSDEYLLALRETQDDNTAKSSNLKIKAKVNLQENTEALVEIDKSQGHALSVKGVGDISVTIVPSQEIMELGGIYNITGGRYHFSALSNVATKDFTIQEGSSIKFNGKPIDSQFDITALYTKKASIEPLISNNKSQGGLRTVECGLHIGNKISAPDLSFKINIPDLDPATKSQVESAFNTEDKVQKQFVAIVLTGSFIPTEESGVTFNGGNAVFSNLSSVMSSQLNNILQTLSIPVDMGLNYQKSNSGKDIFDVAVSTQLFHNRVILNGSVGNRTNTTSASGVVGDIDMEVKLNKSGNLRLKLFSHSPDSYTNYLDNTQRNGLGLSFQSEFTYWKTLWKSIVGTKAEREQIKQARFTRERPLKTIEINE